jgi:hypothetical protein
MANKCKIASENDNAIRCYQYHHLSPIAPNVIDPADLVPVSGLRYMGSNPSSGKVL